MQDQLRVDDARSYDGEIMSDLSCEKLIKALKTVWLQL